MPAENPTPRKIQVAVDVLDDEDVRRRLRRGELVKMHATALAPVDPLVMARLRELASRPLRRRGSGAD
jgi:hypothetical protein